MKVNRDDLFISLISLVKKFNNWENERNLNFDRSEPCFKRVDNFNRIFVKKWNSLFKKGITEKRINFWFLRDIENIVNSYKNSLYRMCLDYTNNFLTVKKFAEYYNINNDTALKIIINKKHYGV